MQFANKCMNIHAQVEVGPVAVKENLDRKNSTIQKAVRIINFKPRYFHTCFTLKQGSENLKIKYVYKILFPSANL